MGLCAELFSGRKFGTQRTVVFGMKLSSMQQVMNKHEGRPCTDMLTMNKHEWVCVYSYSVA